MDTHKPRPEHHFTIEVLNFPNSKNYVNVSYVLTLKNSKRREKFIKELEYFSPSQKVIIMYSERYKETKRELAERTPGFDIRFSHIAAAQYAKDSAPDQNIMIFEDDFFWNRDEDLDKRFWEIMHFINIDKNNVFHYYVGGIPYPSIRNVGILLGKHVRGPIVACHAVIHTPRGIDRTLELEPSGFKKHPDEGPTRFPDAFYCQVSHYYYKPLAYQLFPGTANQDISWKKHVVIGMKLLRLDKQAQPGYNIIYYASVLILTLILAIIYYIMKK